MFNAGDKLLVRLIHQFIGSGQSLGLQSPSKLGHPGDPRAPLVILDPAQSAAFDLARQGYTHSHYLAVLPSRKAPRWLLPIGDPRSTRMGVQIYTPYNRNARMMKGLLIRIIRTGWSGWARSRVLVASREPLPIERLVREVIGERQPVFALSVGNQAVFRKLTVQVMRPDGEILGYVKLPLTASAIKRVRNEALALERLWSSPELRPHIPRLLYAGPWGESCILFQSPLRGQPGPTSFTRMHKDFLQVLWNVHRVERPGQSLIGEIGAKWEKAGQLLGAKWKDLGREVLRRSGEHLNRLTIPCGVSHGDFAPWNTRVQQERLLSFDWESTDWEAPRWWDVFHFDLQTAISLKKHTGLGFSPDGKLAPGPPYLLYMLNSVLGFLEEENWTAIGRCQALLVRQLTTTVHIKLDGRAGEKQTVGQTRSMRRTTPGAEASAQVPSKAKA